MSARIVWALSLWQPWAFAVTHLGKRMENRTWPLPRAVLGARIALHVARGSGRAADWQRAVETVRRITGADLEAHETFRNMERAQRGNLVATARVVECVTESTDPWFFGPFGWRLADLHVLRTPVPCTGNRRLWRVPEALLSRLELEAG